MIIKALNTFGGILDLSALERLQESNPDEKYPFRLYVRPGDIVEVDDEFYSLTRIQEAITLGFIEVGNIEGRVNQTLVNPSYSGTTLALTAGEALIRGDLVYYKSDGKVYKAKADSTSTMICMGIVVGSSVNADADATLLVDGLVRNSSVFSFTVGGQASSATAIVWVSDSTAGKVTQIGPVITTNLVQLVGYAITSDTLHFTLDHTFIELT